MSLICFPANYSESRKRFLESMKKVHATKEFNQWSVPSNSTEKLFVDAVYLPAVKNRKRLFILISGTHGLEGYAGSAIQQVFIEEYLNKMNMDETGVLIVHSLNPYGFHFHKRGTEKGVNLNRNCSIHPEFFNEPNIKSIELTNKFIPVLPVDSETAFMLKQTKQLNDNEVEFDGISLDEFVKVIGLGQFHDPKGLEFGGFQTEPQISSLIKILREIVPQYNDVIHLDLHTGLGDRGRLHILVDGQIEGLHPHLFAEILKPELDSDIYSFTDINDPGFYKTRGATNNLIAELVSRQQRACALTLEFGTLGHDLTAQLEALNSWLLEHQGNWYGYANKDIETKIKKLYLERFFPSEAEWRYSVLSVSREFFKRIFQRTGILIS